LELKLTPDDMKRRGYHTIHYYNPDEGINNQEWAIYSAAQCNPLCIIEYEIFGSDRSSEQVLVNKVKTMSHIFPDWNVVYQALIGTENQCKQALIFIGDAGSKGTSKASELMRSLLTSLTKDQLALLLKQPNETIRILLLRALWQTGRRDHNLQVYIHKAFDWSLVIQSLQSGYADVSWRACGVITNIAAIVTDVRSSLVLPEVLNQLMAILKRAVQFQDKICILTVLNLLANVTSMQHSVMKQKKDILDYVNSNLLDHPDEEIELAGNRLFCNIIGKGMISRDWQQGGYTTTAMAPNLK